MSELTREQVEAMDETMTFTTHRVTQMHRRNELSDQFAPGVIEMEFAGVRMRADAGVDATWLCSVLRGLR